MNFKINYFLFLIFSVSIIRASAAEDETFKPTQLSEDGIAGEVIARIIKVDGFRNDNGAGDVTFLSWECGKTTHYLKLYKDIVRESYDSLDVYKEDFDKYAPDNSDDSNENDTEKIRSKYSERQKLVRKSKGDYLAGLIKKYRAEVESEHAKKMALERADFERMKHYTIEQARIKEVERQLSIQKMLEKNDTQFNEAVKLRFASKEAAIKSSVQTAFESFNNKFPWEKIEYRIEGKPLWHDRF